MSAKSVLWSADEAATATGGKASAAFEITGVTIDSRDVSEGDLFVALKDQRDGHEFVAQALAQGAAAALVSHIPDGVPDGAPLLIVPDTLRALEDLGRAARARINGKVIAVTGSVGKTSTKEMLRAMLAGQGKVHAAERSFNNHWGVPLTLARMPRDTEFAVIEIGMNHAGEIRPLVKMARPDCAIITNVAPVHMAHFNSVEEIADAKAEILEGLEPDGTAILNRDNPYYQRLKRQAQKLSVQHIERFGEAQRADARLLSLSLHDAASTMQARIHDQDMIVRIGAAGGHLALNALAGLLAVDAVGGDLALAGLALANWKTPSGRGERWRVALDATGLDGAVTLIDESYNANPLSMGAALDVLSASATVDNIGRIPKGRRIAFLGDMLELGVQENELHAGLADHRAIAQIDKLHCVGPRMKSLYEALPADRRGEWAETSVELSSRVKHLLDGGDVAMVKGSLGSRMALIVDAIKKMGQADKDLPVEQQPAKEAK